MVEIENKATDLYESTPSELMNNLLQAVEDHNALAADGRGSKKSGAFSSGPVS
jgi:hypothetical protein